MIFIGFMLYNLKVILKLQNTIEAEQGKQYKVVIHKVEKYYILIIYPDRSQSLKPLAETRNITRLGFIDSRLKAIPDVIKKCRIWKSLVLLKK